MPPISPAPLDRPAQLTRILDATLTGSGVAIEVLGQLSAKVRWRPHVVETAAKRGWHCASSRDSEDVWMSRLERALDADPSIKLGLCAPSEVLRDEKVLDFADRVGAKLCTVEVDDSANYGSPMMFGCAADLIYTLKLPLTTAMCRQVLDRNLQRAIAAPTNALKGVKLELVAAVVMSQVTGYEVHAHDISNRHQQIDVAVHNRNTSGILSGGELVIVEAKNWSNPVGTGEYHSLMRKVETRHGRCKLGLFVTTDRYTAGVEEETLRDSRTPYLIATLDKTSFPNLWRSGAGITAQLERAVLDASIGKFE